MVQSHGYSGTPLFKKLGMKPGMRCLTIRAPGHYLDLIAGAEDVHISSRFRRADIVHLFCKNQKTFESLAVKSLARVADGGMLWVSWPKKSSPMHIDLTEDDLRRTLLPTGWVDVKVCAVDADWSGLKFLRRKQ
ncbi:MAG: DUF3052 domain-containing protein [Pseudomonadota bacterium]